MYSEEWTKSTEVGIRQCGEKQAPKLTCEQLLRGSLYLTQTVKGLLRQGNKSEF